jgi:hypothetical protein
MSGIFSQSRFALPLLLLLTAKPFLGQITVTGAISGTVVDPSGRVIPTAAVTLVNEKTGDTRKASTNNVGVFNFLAILPDTYSIRIERTGFKTYQQTRIVLTANGRVDLGNVQIQIRSDGIDIRSAA